MKRTVIQFKAWLREQLRLMYVFAEYSRQSLPMGQFIARMWHRHEEEGRSYFDMAAYYRIAEQSMTRARVRRRHWYAFTWLETQEMKCIEMWYPGIYAARHFSRLVKYVDHKNRRLWNKGEGIHGRGKWH